MDVLSDALRVVRLSGAVFFTAEISQPWASFSPPSDRLRPLLAPDAECVALFHILAEGEPCWVTIEGQPPVKMSAGDLIILPRGDAHVMASDPALAPVAVEQALQALSTLLRDHTGNSLPAMKYGGGGAATRLVCGYLHCDQSFNPLLGAMPQVISVRVKDGAALVRSTGIDTELRALAMPPETANWLESTLRHMVSEALASSPSSRTMLARLAELLFAEVMRRYVEQLPASESGWLAGLHDPQVGRVLRLLHAEPARAWTVTALGKEAGISRSALAERFQSLIGESPMRYLAGWRMQLAKRRLRETGQSIAEIAVQVGYDSEAAFNRAFRRLVGRPPATWRNGGRSKLPRADLVAPAFKPAAGAAGRF